MTLLGGEIAGLFGIVFGPIYLPGTLARVTLAHDGEGGGTSSETTQPCRVQVDACTEAQRGQPGYTGLDVRLIILQSGIVGGVRSGDAITINDGPLAGKKFDIAPNIIQDPASSYWDCRATPSHSA